MSKRREPLGDQFRRAVNASGRSRYSICKACGIDQASFSRFMAGKVGLTLANLEAVADLLGLRIVADAKPTKATRPAPTKQGHASTGRRTRRGSKGANA